MIVYSLRQNCFQHIKIGSFTNLCNRREKKVIEKGKSGRMMVPARRVPRRLKAIHFMFPCCKNSSITSGKSPCNGSSPIQTPNTTQKIKFSSRKTSNFFRLKEKTREAEEKTDLLSQKRSKRMNLGKKTHRLLGHSCRSAFGARK